jgi:methylmalonyl-CoA/ethylmalonyl-CoA epimerase
MSKEALSSNAISHIGLIVRDIERSADRWAKLLGVERPKAHMTDPLEKTNARFRGEPTQAQAKLAFLPMGDIKVELIEPVGGPSTWKEFLDRKGEGIHHIGVNVKDSQRDAELFATRGMGIIQRGEFTGGCYTYLDTEQMLGITLELIESS